MIARPVLNDAIINRFIKLLGSQRVKISEAQKAQFDHDEGHFIGVQPNIVIEPIYVSEVAEVLKICNEAKCAVVPFGTGTGLEGGAICTKPGITLSLLQLEGGVTEVNEYDFDCSVRPSVTRLALNDHVRNTGLFFPVDPGADASICGMVATSASGTNAVRYGTMKQNVLNVEVVLADGTILDTRGKDRRPRKSAAGYNLTDLFIGSEGTLGVITKATIKLHARPNVIALAVTSFPTIHDAVSAVVEVLQCSIPIARIELLDDSQIAACNAYSHTELPVKPTLFLEFHSASENEAKSQSEFVADICKNHFFIEYNSSCNETEKANLWKARHSAYYATLALRKGSVGFCTDVCVPITKLTKIIEETKTDLKKNGIVGTIVGHVGDGNFHVILPVFKADKEEMSAVESFSDRLVTRALNVGGTCTGEHGIGLGKIKYLEKEIGAGGIYASQMLKKAFDPNNIMNPGKVLREWL